MEKYRLLLVPGIGGAAGYIVAKHYNKSVLKCVLIGAAATTAITLFAVAQALKKMN